MVLIQRHKAVWQFWWNLAGKSIVRKMFDREILIKTLHTTVLRIFCESFDIVMCVELKYIKFTLNISWSYAFVRKFPLISHCIHSGNYVNYCGVHRELKHFSLIKNFENVISFNIWLIKKAIPWWSVPFCFLP